MTKAKGSKNDTKSRFIALVVVFVVAATLLLAVSRAASPSVSVQPDDSILTTQDDTAYEGSYTRFKQQGGNQTGGLFIPDSLEDWEFFDQINYTASNEVRYASPGGSGSGEGTSRASPISINRAISVAKPGDVIYLLPGTYNQQVTIDGVKGAPNKPIVFTAEFGNARMATISHGSSYIFRVKNSNHIIIDSLVFDGKGSSVWGVATGRTWDGDKAQGDNIDISFISNEIKNVGKEYSLNFSRTVGAVAHNNYIHDGGYIGFGEGVYVGCGNCSTAQNTSKGLVLTNNKIVNVGGEGIEIKHGVRDVLISDNLVTDSGWQLTYGSTCCYGGGIVIHYVSNSNEYDTNAIVERNRVGRVSQHGFVVGAGNTILRDNIAWSTGANHFNQEPSNNTLAREPYALNNLFSGGYDEVSLINNHAFSISKPLFTDSNNYGNTSRAKANILVNDITKHANESAAFSAWKESSFSN